MIVTCGLIQPFTSVTSNWLDLLNESFVLLTQYHLMCFTKFVQSYEMK